MKKELKDYLHLYKGCTMQCINQDCNDELEYFGRKCTLSLIILRKFTNGYWKPILRPLDSMTNEEEKQVLKINDSEGPVNSMSFSAGRLVDFYFKKTNFEVMRYLLSLYFDLYGLIPAGLAIDATNPSVQECDATAAK